MLLNYLNKNIDYSSPAVIENNKSYSYSDLENKSNIFADIFYHAGIKEKDFIPLLSENNFRFIAAIIGLWKLGAVPVPLNVRLTESEIKTIVDFTGSNKIITDNHFSDLKNIPLPEIYSIKKEAKISEKKIDKQKVALILFTSGSSGEPKGVMLTFDNLIQSAEIGNKIFNQNKNDRWLASLPFYHIGGFSIIIRSIVFGASIIIPPSLKTEDIFLAIVNHKPTLASFVSTQLQRLIDNNINPNKELRNVLLGGGFIDPVLLNNSIKKDWKISKVYGSTETSSFVSILPFESISQSPNSVGRPLHPVQIKIVNDNAIELPPNQTGEIIISGPIIMKGYLKNKNETKKKMRNDFYFSGDIGYKDENGFLFIEARRSDLIVTGGENVNPAEVEKFILQIKNIKECVVYGKQDMEWGQVICAAIVLTGKEKISTEKIKSYLKDKIAGFKIPQKIIFTNELPKTSLGKIQREKLKELIDKN